MSSESTSKKGNNETTSTSTTVYANSDFSVLLTKFLAGGTAASIAVTATAPLERTKLILQIQNRSTSIPPHLRYKGIIDCLRRIPEEQGFLSFWRGNTASVIRCFPYHAFNFSVKDTLRDQAIYYFQPKTVKSQMIVNLVTGGLAGAIALIIIYPLDYARTRLAMDIGNKTTREYRNVRECIRDAYEANGVRGVYRGLYFSVFGVFMYRAAYFGLYDSGIDFIPLELRSIWTQFLLAEVSATTAGFVSFPLDTVRRSMMMQSGKSPKADQNKSSIDITRGIYKTEGIKGFFRGSLANVIRGTGGALMLILYDSLNYILLGKTGHNFHQKPLTLEEKISESERTTTLEDSTSIRHHKVHNEGSRGSLCNF